jgi:hypothetical protein
VDVRDRKIVKQERLAKVFDSATGKEVLSLADGNVLLDATGTLMAYQQNGATDHALVEIASGKVVGSIEPFPTALGPGGEFLGVMAGTEFGMNLHRNGNKTPLVTLGMDNRCSAGRWVFSRDGSRLAWGNRDGTVTVCDLAEVKNRLDSVGLGW